MYKEPINRIDNQINSILLIGNNCINNQFIQREIEKKCNFNFSRRSTQEIENCENLNTTDIVIISYNILINCSNIHLVLSKTLSNKWIIYDVPNNIEETNVAEIQTCSFINLKGVIYQDAPVEHLTRCLNTVRNDDYWLPRKIMAQMLSNIQPKKLILQENQENLTKREIQIFNMLIKGASNLEISEELFISECTVKTHIYNIYKKIKVSNRKEAIRKATYISKFDYEKTRNY